MEGDDPLAMHQAHGGNARQMSLSEIQRHPDEARELRKDRAPALADDRACERRRAGPGRKSWTESRWRERGARIRCPSRIWTSRSTSSFSNEWMRSYRPHELFDEARQHARRVAGACAHRPSRLGMNPHANGGELLVPFSLPHFREYALKLGHLARWRPKRRACSEAFLRDVMASNNATAEFPPLRSRRNRIQPARSGV